MVRSYAVLVLLYVILAAGISLAGDKHNPSFAFDPVFAQLNQAELVFTGKLTKIPRPTIRSVPLIEENVGLNYVLQFAEVAVLRGVQPGEWRFQYSTFKNYAPNFSQYPTWLVAASRFNQIWAIDYIAPAKEQLVALAKQAVALPVGWSLEDGRPVSPWAVLGNKAWHQNLSDHQVPVCSKSSRPALLVGEKIELNVEQVPPVIFYKYKNKYGDGKFRITVTNRDNQPVVVPALLSDGKTIFWEDSLLIITSRYNPPGVGPDRIVCLLPEAGKASKLQPATLQPGESVATTIDTLALKGVRWPRGGRRIYFLFCLGEKSSTNFFYYYHQIHDRMRATSKRRLQTNGLHGEGKGGSAILLRAKN